MAPDLAEMGITDVWLPPPSNSVAREGYLPSRLFELDGGYGSEEELKKLIRTFHANGIAAVMDVVINHRCGDKQDENGNWTLYSDEVSHDKRRIDWGPWALGSNHPVDALAGTGNPKSEPYYPAAPNVDHHNAEVRKAITAWLTYMTSPRYIGFDSLRFDFVRGYDVSYLREYVESTVGSRGEMCVAEYWDDDEGNNPRYTTGEILSDYVDKAGPSVGAFDFPLKGAIMDALSTGDMRLLVENGNRMPGLAGIRPGQAFTFVENHDTSAPQCHWPFPENTAQLTAGYAYLLSHPGIPVVFWPHLCGKKNIDGVLNGKPIDPTLTEAAGSIDKRNVWVPPEHEGFSWEERWPGTEKGTVGSQDGVQGPNYSGVLGDTIAKLCRARREVGISSTSRMQVIKVEEGLYVADIYGGHVYGSAREGASKADFVKHLRVAIGPKANTDFPMPETCPLDENSELPTCVTVDSGAMHRVMAFTDPCDEILSTMADLDDASEFVMPEIKMPRTYS